MRTRGRGVSSVGVLLLTLSACVPAWAGADQTAPRRIVSTSPSLTETLFALGLGGRVVGVSVHCRYPPQVADLPRVGSFFNPDGERIAALRPDLVLVHNAASGVDRRLGSIGIRAEVVAYDNLASIYTNVARIGALTGAMSQADMLRTRLQQELHVLRRATEDRTPVRVLFIIGRRAGMLADIVAVGHGSYLDDLITAAGAINVLSASGTPAYPRISLETVLRLDPDVIVDTVDMGETDAKRAERQHVNEELWAAQRSLRAVRTQRVYAATTDALVVPGPRVVEAARWIAGIVHGSRRP